MNAALIINIVTSVTVFILGLLFTLGFVGKGVQPSLRVSFGIIFVAYGIYRFINMLSKRKEFEQEKRREQMREEREKLFDDKR